MKTKKLKKISKELLKASAMHRSQANRIKSMLQSGGIRSRYDSEINRFTDAKKSLEEIKKAKRASARYMKKGGYMDRMMRQMGGMYADNTVAAAGQGNAGSTANIVYQESDPRLQEERISAMEQEKEALTREAESTEQELKQQEEMDKVAVQQAGAQAGQKTEQIAGYAKMGIEQGTKFLQKRAAQQLQQQGLKWAGSQAAGSALKSEVSSMLASQATKQAGKEITGELVGFGAKDALSAFGQQALPELGGEVVKTVGKEVGKEVVEEVGKQAITETGKAVGKEGLKSAVGSSVNPNAIAMAASLVGNIGGAFVDDQDETTWTAKEASFDILGDAGEYAGYGAMLGSVIPGVGNAVGAAAGALIGTGKAIWTGLAGRKKARKEEAKLEAKRKEKVQKDNKQLRKRYGAQLARMRAGEMQQKTYSGYDLGRNVIAQMGGMRMGMPRYGYAA
tara:strand:- start:608 stop:1957 length:1350 start_codon:yes stop_codon:yes gene_type:complete